MIWVLLKHGKSDSRSQDSLRLHFASAGCGNTDPVGIGKEFMKEEDPERRDQILTMIGGWSIFIWECVQGMQRKAGQPELPGFTERSIYSALLRQFLNISSDVEMGFESITLCLMEIFPFRPRNELHLDKFNCDLPTTSQTGAMNMVICDRETGKYYLFQVICNFRSAITNKCVPYHRALKGIFRHLDTLNETITKRYLEVYGGKEINDSIPTPLDRTTFYLDDELEYDTLILDEKHRCQIEVLKLPIGYSRTFSLSAPIHVLNKLRPFLNQRQLVEMCFVCSMLNTHLRFYYSMISLVNKAEIGVLEFSSHPFYQWLSTTTEMFRNWQGGPYPRYSCAGIKDIGTFFGMASIKNSNPLVDMETGQNRLEEISRILSEFLQWVDLQVGKNCFEDIPVPVIKSQMMLRCNQIQEIVPGFEFSIFRLQIFLNHAIGCLVGPGRHLHQLFFPARGMGSYKHLKDGCGDECSPEEAKRLSGDVLYIPKTNKTESKTSIADKDMDQAMIAMSEHLGLEFPLRNLLEVGACESTHSRQLGKRDVLVKGIPIYDLNNHGQMVCKKYGKNQSWKLLKPNQYYCDAFDIVHHVVNDTILEVLVKNLSTNLNDIVKNKPGKVHVNKNFDGRKPTMGHYHHYTVYGYHTNNNDPTKYMKVLTQSNYKVKLDKCIRFENFDGGKAVIERTKELMERTMKNMVGKIDCFGACIHLQERQRENKSVRLDLIDPHKEKVYFDWVTFVPLCGKFWTIVAVPKVMMGSVIGIMASKSEFDMFLDDLNTSERVTVENYLRSTEALACNEYGCDVDMQVYECKPGTMLTFEVSKLIHGTITDIIYGPRDLLIVHPFEECTKFIR